MPQYSDPRIPTLTQRVEPTIAPEQPNTGAAKPEKHDDLPVLTDRAESTLPPQPQSAPSAPWDEDELPVLTDVTNVSDVPDVPETPDVSGDPGASTVYGSHSRAPVSRVASDAAGGVGLPQAAFSTAATGGGADMSVLRAALQAEFEQALQQALDEAASTLRARLEAELPAMIERAVNKVRPG